MQNDTINVMHNDNVYCFDPKTVPLWEKSNLTIEEAAIYSNIGQGKLRQLTEDENCPFVLWVGRKRLIKRKSFDAYIERAYSV